VLVGGPVLLDKTIVGIVVASEAERRQATVTIAEQQVPNLLMNALP